MKAPRSLRSFFLPLILLVLAGQSACAPWNSGATAQPTSENIQVSQTMVSEAPPSMIPSPPPASLPTETSTPFPQNLSAPTDTSLPIQTTPLSSPASSSVNQEVCNKAAPGSPIDITIPDNTEMYPGQAFTKIWRLVNVGRCFWTTEYTVEWFSGEKFGDIQIVSLGTEVAHRQSIDIAVDMIAPLQPGTYQSNWKLRSPDKGWFGIGPNGDQAFWVRIIVIQLATNTPTPTETIAPPSPTPTPTPLPTLTLTPTATPLVLVSGPVLLVAGDRLDLDTAQVNTQGEDLAFSKDEASHHWFAPQSGAILGVYGGDVPPLAICLSANMSAAPIPVESLSPGTYLCYRTDQGMLGWLRYDNFNPETASIGLTILTWASLYK